ncbi:hypothetical protein [Streptomyces celluloflavus]|uniref:hypothetical protein n=1 Tax=Streptomyces celluloflavus TaxID=58344 RepID=UPI0036C3E1B3
MRLPGETPTFALLALVHAVPETGCDAERSKRRARHRRLDSLGPAAIGKNRGAFMAAV